jgi:eukaryotic-like serine/threonine-protein kinase
MSVEVSGLAAVGDVLAGKYRVDKILGVGGMGMVVAATHLELDQRVALKFMLPGAAESPETSARFLREARAAGRLNSDHVCRMVDLGRFDNGAPYIVMEYLEGYDLHSLMKRRGVLKLSDAVDYVLQACEGMAEAHTKGIVHRDLKPGNLFISKRADGTSLVKVLDFGISKAAGMASTKTGDVMGSPAYMSPEQMKSSKDVDARADIWSLGVMLYQLVTGLPPFHADSLPAMCLRVLNEEPDALQSLRADLPDGFCDAVNKALAKERDDRFSDVGELAAAIAPFGGDTASFSVTRIAGVLHPSAAASSRMSMAHMDLIPTVIGTESRLAETSAPPSAGSKTPEVMAAASVTTFSAGAGESVNQMPRRWMSYGWLGAVVVAAGTIVLLLVMVMKSGNEPTATNASQPSLGAAPPVETRSADKPADTKPGDTKPGDTKPGGTKPADPTAETTAPPSTQTIVVTPLPPVPPPDPPVHVEQAPPPVTVVKQHHTHRPPRPPKAAAGSAAGSAAAAGSNEVSDDDWTHMQHDRPKPE